MFRLDSDIITGIQTFAKKNLRLDFSYYLHWSDVVSANIGRVGDDNFDSPSMIFGYDVIETLKKTSFQDGSFHLIEVGVYFGANGAHFFSGDKREQNAFHMALS